MYSKFCITGYLSCDGETTQGVNHQNLYVLSKYFLAVVMVLNAECVAHCCWVQAGTRLFGFIGAGATLGQLVGSLLAVALARLGPGWYLYSAT